MGVKPGINIKTWSDVDYYIAEIRSKETEVIQLQRQYDDGVLKLQKKFIDHQTTLKDEIEFTKGKMKDFCDANRSDMVDQRKKSLSNGEVYYRALPIKIKLMEGITELTVIKKLKDMGMKFYKKYITIKPSLSLESIKKDVKELSIDEAFLNEIGMRTETGENFNVKANP